MSRCISFFFSDSRLSYRFVPRQMLFLAGHSELIPGVVDVVRAFRVRGLKIGSTTGYTRSMLDLLVEKAAARGYLPDCSLTPEDAGGGRPHPYMIYEAAKRLQAYPLWTFVKVGDTAVDMEEGRNAGCWSIGITSTGNLKDLPEDKARAELLANGAHYTARNLEETLPLLDDIGRRLEAGERP